MCVKYILILSLLSVTIYGKKSSDTRSYIDFIHSSISNQVSYLSEYIDIQLSGYDSNLSKKVLNNPRVDSIDSFFQTKKFIDATDKTFARARFGSLYQSKYDNNLIYKLRAHIPLSRTKKRYNLFFEDITENDKNENEQSTLNIGINYFSPKTYGIESKYSLGTSGIRPYVRARFTLEFKTKEWHIEPVQIFKYSLQNKFEENTNVYIDTSLSKSELLRYTIFRGTQEEAYGMDYSFTISYFNILSNKTALSLSQSFSGNIGYKEVIDVTQDTIEFAGINNYTTSLNIRQNVWKKWFFYELTPAVNFHREHKYKVNYSLLFTLDIYFGKLYKSN